MTNEQIALLQLLTVGGIGAMLLLAGVFICIFRRRKNRLCTGTTMGYIAKHQYYGEGRIAPVVGYFVDGKEYFVTRKFNGIITTKKVSVSHLYEEDGAYVSHRDYLHVPMSAVTNVRKMAQRLWPVGSEMQVFYNPGKPKQAYAERIPKGMSFAAVSFLCGGTGVMLLSVLMYFVVRNG